MASAGTSCYSDVSALFIMPTVSLGVCAMINSRLGEEVFPMTSWHDTWLSLCVLVCLCNNSCVVV